jgi:hypothetical protein
VKALIILALLIVSFSCASINLIRPIATRKYTLDVSSGLWIWQTCIKRSFFKRECKKWFKHNLDTSKKEDRKTINQLGFVLGAREF